VYNAITPSGTNTVHGEGSWRFQRKPFAAFPFFAPNRALGKPPTDVNVYTFDSGGPIVRNRTHYFAGYENLRRDFSGGRVISTKGSKLLNEARVQYAQRDQSRVPGSQAGSGPAIVVTGVANFGGPVAANADVGFGFTEKIFQVTDNVTYLRGDHSYKMGFNAQ